MERIALEQSQDIALSQTEQRALTLLGQGIPPEQVASTLGVTPARISQLLADENFSNLVSLERYNRLQSHNKRDSIYDEIEDDLLKRLKIALPLMFKPDTLLKAIQTINAAKRRGQSTPEQITNQTNIVNLLLPVQVKQKFTTNVHNQVIKAGTQELLTMPSEQLLKTLEASQAAKLEHLTQEKEVVNVDTNEKTISASES